MRRISVLALVILLFSITTGARAASLAQGDSSPAPSAQATVQPATLAPPGQQTGVASSPVDSLGQAITTLGVFSAIMLVLAVGTEAVVDLVKLLVGLKGKPTALEALRQLQDWLPGTLEDLGAGQADRQRVERYIQQLKQPITDIAGNVADAEQALEHIRTWLAEQGKDLLVKDAYKLILDREADLVAFLKGKGLQDSITSGVVAALKNTLKQLDALNVSELNLESLQKLLQAVEQRRRNIQSPLVKVLLAAGQQGLQGWDRLAHQRGVPQPRLALGVLTTVVILVISSGLVLAPDGLATPVDRLTANVIGLAVFAALVAVIVIVLRATIRRPDVVPNLTMQTVAAELLARQDQHHDEEETRLRLLRVVSLLVGILLATWLAIDAGQLLVDLIGDGLATRLSTRLFAGLDDPFYAQWPVFGTLWAGVKSILVQLTPGILLSGLAASAGSAFWHDSLDKLRVVKQAQEQLKSLAQPASDGDRASGKSA